MIFTNKTIALLLCLALAFITGNVHAVESSNTKQSEQIKLEPSLQEAIQVKEELITPVVKEDWYSVEYIIFEHNTRETQLTEPWKGTAISTPENPIFLDTASADNSGISALDSRQKQLYGVYSRLTKLSAYTPIRHAGWIQRAEENSPVMHISITPTMEENRLEGTLNLRRGRYTHLDIDLQLSDANNTLSYPAYADANTPVPTNTANIYRLTETRRVKKEDINYFDHPRFGVIAKIEKIDPPHRAIKQEALIAEPLEKLDLTKDSVAPPATQNDN